MRVMGIVLAAGAGSRFGSVKQLAPLDGRPLLQHPLDALAAAGMDEVVVVLGDDAAAIESSIAWRGERRCRNPRPQDGLASSLRVGLDAAAEDASVEAVLVVLGDQPSLRADVIRAVLDAAGSTDRPIVRVRWGDDDAPNPVLVRRSAWALAAGLDGDRGLGPLLTRRPELVAEVRVDGRLPDVDTPGDLASLEARAAGVTGGSTDAGR
jgi:molybdenum cofactor cytidylyltransferase